MIPWWVGLMMLVAGAVIGFFLTALMIANGRSDPRD